jgi:hypothetical protein
MPPPPLPPVPFTYASPFKVNSTRGETQKRYKELSTDRTFNDGTENWKLGR